MACCGIIGVIVLIIEIFLEWETFKKMIKPRPKKLNLKQVRAKKLKN